MPAPANGVYSFQSVQLAIIGPPAFNQIFTGAANEGYRIEMDGDKVTGLWGADGAFMSSLMAKQGGALIVTVLKTSAINRFLNNLYNTQSTVAAYVGRNTLTLRDTNLGDTLVATGASVRKLPNLTYAAEGGTNEWGFLCGYITTVLGDGGVTNLVTNG